MCKCKQLDGKIYHDEAYCIDIIRGFCETWSKDGKGNKVYLQYHLPIEGVKLYQSFGWFSSYENEYTLLHKPKSML